MIKEEQKLSEKILDYLHKHPGAGDTPGGITSWWLDMDTNEPSIEKVNHALEILVKKGLIKKLPFHGGTTLYKKEILSMQKEK
jgi:Fe2+ or Zn2+ uptake regulation protein